MEDFQMLTLRNVPAARNRNTALPSTDRLDADVLYALVRQLDRIVRKLSPKTRRALAQTVLRHRTRLSLRLARANDLAEDRLLQTVWRAGLPTAVHLAVGPLTAAADEACEFLACGHQASGISMSDPRWQHGTEKSAPVTCRECLKLLVAA
jgi:hypothetical protein